VIHWHRAHLDSRSIKDRIADRIAAIGCSFGAFIWACVVVLVWAALGPHYDYSDTWQLVINTGTTIVTFLMAFLIGANQGRQADRDRHHAEADYQVNLTAEARIEALQLHLARIENDKLDRLLTLLSVEQPRQ
jgi:low affinity Fe/Cu permease